MLWSTKAGWYLQQALSCTSGAWHISKIKNKSSQGLPGSPVVKEMSSHCRAKAPFLAGELRSRMPRGAAKPSNQMAWYQGKNTTARRLLNQFPVVHIICRIVI